MAGDRGLAYSYQLLYSNELALQMVPIVNLKLTIDVNIRVPDQPVLKEHVCTEAATFIICNRVPPSIHHL